MEPVHTAGMPERPLFKIFIANLKPSPSAERSDDVWQIFKIKAK